MFSNLSFCLFTLAAGAALAQVGQPATSPDRIEVSITRSVNLKIEEAAFAVQISAPSSASLTTLLKALEPAGIKETDLLGITPFFGPPSPVPSVTPRVIYNFQMRAPIAQLSDSLQKLDQLRRSLLAGTDGFELNGQNLMGFGASEKTRDAARVQLTSDALADARARAETLARAAGVTLGPIVGLAEFPSGFVGGGGPGGTPLTTTAAMTVTVRFSTGR